MSQHLPIRDRMGIRNPLLVSSQRDDEWNAVPIAPVSNDANEGWVLTALDLTKNDRRPNLASFTAESVNPGCCAANFLKKTYKLGRRRWSMNYLAVCSPSCSKDIAADCELGRGESVVAGPVQALEDNGLRVGTRPKTLVGKVPKGNRWSGSPLSP